MSGSWQGPGWWLASDGQWYPPHLLPGAHPVPQTVPSIADAENLNRVGGNPATSTGAGLAPTITVLAIALVLNAVVMLVAGAAALRYINHSPLPIQRVVNGRPGIVLNFGGSDAVTYLMVLAIGISASAVTSLVLFGSRRDPTRWTNGRSRLVPLLGILAAPVSVISLAALVPSDIFTSVEPDYGNLYVHFVLPLFAVLTVVSILLLGGTLFSKGIPFTPSGALVALGVGVAVLMCGLQVNSMGRSLSVTAIPSINPCSLLTLSDARAILPSQPVTQSRAAGTGTCTYVFGKLGSTWETSTDIAISLREGQGAVEALHQSANGISKMTLYLHGGTQPALWAGGVLDPRAPTNNGILEATNGTLVIVVTLVNLTPARDIAVKAATVALSRP